MDAVEVRVLDQILKHVQEELAFFEEYRRVPTVILANTEVIDEIQRSLNRVPNPSSLVSACLKSTPATCMDCPLKFRFKLYGVPVIEVDSLIPVEVR
jgi:hypothetical protein